MDTMIRLSFSNFRPADLAGIGRASWFPVGLAACLCCLAAASANAQENAPARSSESYKVTYTGRLFGYYRIPEVQKIEMQWPKLSIGDKSYEYRCSGKVTEHDTPEAYRFAQGLAMADEAPTKADVKTSLRVAAGDNFAPFLLARQMWDPVNQKLVEKELFLADPATGQWAPEAGLSESGYETVLRGDGAIPQDNVGCFLRRMGFDAVVPGEEDFYYGPSRLRYLEKFLKMPAKYSEYDWSRDPAQISEPELEDLHPTKMLGVNLYMDTKDSLATAGSPAPATPADQPPLAQITSPPRVTAPKVALPWMRTVEVAGWVNGSYTACVVYVDRIKAAHSGKSLAQMDNATQAGLCGGSEFPLTPAGPRQLRIDNKTPLPWDTKYAVAVLLITPDAKGRSLAAWAPFSVQPPFFGYSGVSQNKRVGNDDQPWFLTPDDRVAVFGVVDPSLLQFVGKFSDMWSEEKPSGPFQADDTVETDLLVSDPAEALSQALDYCHQIEGCKGAHKVLLAQMPQPTAYNMLASFRAPRLLGAFDLVIAEADPDRGSGTRTIVKEPDEDALPFKDPVVLVPDPGALVVDRHLPSDHFPETMRVKLQAAIVSPGDPSSAHGTPRLVQNVALHPALDAVRSEWLPTAATPPTSPLAVLAPMMPPGGLTLLDHLQAQPNLLVANTKLAGAGPANDEDWKEGMRQAALKTMARYCHSDMAMMQLRDVFWAPIFSTFHVNKEGFEALMKAIYWRGDVIKCMNVSGSVVNSALQRSKDLQQTQYYGLLSDASLSNDWSLTTLGANEEQQDQSFRQVGNKLIDPKRLYSIGTTPFLSNGDTGYTAFQGAEPPPAIPLSKLKTQVLSDVIAGLTPPQPSPAEGYKDALARVPIMLKAVATPGGPVTPHLSPGPYPLHKPDTTFTDWWKALFEGPKANLGADPLQLEQEHKNSWSLILYKADFSYSLSYHNGLEREIPKSFAGVSAVDLTQADSSAITFDYLVRLDRDLGKNNRNEFYLQSEANYGYKKTRQAAKTASAYGDPYTRNQTADFLYNEAGFAHHFSPRHQSPYGWQLQLPVGLQTQLQPLVALPEGATAGTATPVIKSPRTIYAEVRPGLRWEFSFPKPSDWSPNPAGAGGANAGGAGASTSGGSGGKGGKGGGSQSSSSQGSGGGAGGAGGGQTSTFDSFFEFGYQAGPALGPKDYEFKDPSGVLTTAVPVCLPQSVGPTVTVVGVDSVVNCFNAASSLPANSTLTAPTLVKIDPGRTHFQNGLYTNYRIDMPLPVKKDDYHMFSNMEFVTELRSDYFFGPFFGDGKDSPIDTHFLFDAKQTLTIPIFPLFSGKLSLAPTFESIFYANKISNNVYRSYSTSVTLSYAFEKRKGLSWRRALGYSNPTPATPTLPSR